VAYRLAVERHAVRKQPAPAIPATGSQDEVATP
jgi:hypothetical protein